MHRRRRRPVTVGRICSTFTVIRVDPYEGVEVVDSTALFKSFYVASVWLVFGDWKMGWFLEKNRRKKERLSDN